jgi:hypothetical protein
MLKNFVLLAEVKFRKTFTDCRPTPEITEISLRMLYLSSSRVYSWNRTKFSQSHDWCCFLWSPLLQFLVLRADAFGTVAPELVVEEFSGWNFNSSTNSVQFLLLAQFVLSLAFRLAVILFLAAYVVTSWRTEMHLPVTNLKIHEIFLVQQMHYLLKHKIITICI